MTEKKKVFLTTVGVGTFMNPLSWITRAIQKALTKAEGLGLDVTIVYFDPAMEAELGELVRRLYSHHFTSI